MNDFRHFKIVLLKLHWCIGNSLVQAQSQTEPGVMENMRITNMYISSIPKGFSVQMFGEPGLSKMRKIRKKRKGLVPANLPESWGEKPLAFGTTPPLREKAASWYECSRRDGKHDARHRFTMQRSGESVLTSHCLLPIHLQDNLPTTALVRPAAAGIGHGYMQPLPCRHSSAKVAIRRELY
jgi:hypothetical protein